MQLSTGVNLRRLALGKLTAAEASAGDAQLQHAIERDVRSGQERAVLALHIGQLQPPAPRLYHRRIAKAMLDNAAQSHAGQVFARGNSDLVLICDPDAATRLRDTLGRLFRIDAPVSERLTSLWALPQDAIALEAYLSHTMAAGTIAEEAAITPETIGALKALVAAAPVADFIQRQTAVQFVPAGMTSLYTEFSFSMQALGTRLNLGKLAIAGLASPGAPPAGLAAADAYLFRHFTSTLDSQMMEWLTPELAGTIGGPATPALHLNLGVRAVLSPGFLRLADAADAASVRLGVEIALIDACADLLAFGAARMVLHAHGYALVLDGVGHQMLQLTRLEALEPDWVKLEWSPQVTKLGQREQHAVSEALARLGPKRVVLNRAETPLALEWAVAQGIRQFQGRHVDTLLAVQDAHIRRNNQTVEA